MLYFVRKLLFLIFRIIPINNKKVVFSSFYGNGYCDNPKYIAMELISQYSDLNLYWIVKNYKDLEIPPEIKTIKSASIFSIYHLATAKIWIDNCRKGFSTLKRSNQLYIQTWHGFGPKRCEKDVEEKLSSDYIKNAKHDAAMCDLMISSSTKLTQIYKHGFWYSGEILESGYPRNDLLLVEKDVNVKQKVEKIFGLDSNTKIVLYAPTFRRDSSMNQYCFDFYKVLDAFSERWHGDWIMLIRMHPNISYIESGIPFDSKKLFNATNYVDMQELLSRADAFITDYSSSITDYLLTKKPSFIYATDIEEYKKDRDFYFDLSELPGPVCINEKSLIKEIKFFDEKAYEAKRKHFISTMGIVTDGKASNIVVNWIAEKLSI